MKRAWMLSAAESILFVTSIGCASGGANWRWGQASQRDDPDTELLSKPMELSPEPVGAVSDSQTVGESGEEVTLLAGQIEAYYGAQPGADDSPESTGGRQGAPTSQPAGTSAASEDLFGPPAARTAPLASQGLEPQPGSQVPTEPTPTEVTAPPAEDASISPVEEFPMGVDQNVMRAASPLAPDTKAPAVMPGQRRPRIELLDIQPAPEADAKTEPVTSPNQPTVDEHAAFQLNGMASLIGELEQSVSRHPEQLDSRLKLGLLYLLTGQDEKMADTIETGDPIQSELLAALLKMLTAAKAIIQEPSAPPAPALLAAEELRRLLGQRSAVVIPKIALVTHVNSFGDYEEVTRRQFPAGQPVSVFLYTEVENFRSKPTTDGKLLTQLSQKVEVFDATGKTTDPIWYRAESNIEDRVSSPRRDFFIPFPIDLPADTPPGEYIIKVTVEDLIGHTTDQQRMTITIGPSLPRERETG